MRSTLALIAAGAAAGASCLFSLCWTRVRPSQESWRSSWRHRVGGCPATSRESRGGTHADAQSERGIDLSVTAVPGSHRLTLKGATLGKQEFPLALTPGTHRALISAGWTGRFSLSLRDGERE